jgi:hypothetical protein
MQAAEPGYAIAALVEAPPGNGKGAVLSRFRTLKTLHGQCEQMCNPEVGKVK